MHSFLSRRTMISALVVVLGLATAVPAAATSAKPDSTLNKRGFRLFAKASGSMRVNQIVCGILSDGQICVDSTGSSTIPGSVWPKGTNNQYTFNSGISVAGIIGPEVAGWAGDTTGAFFFDGAGKSNGEQVEPIFNASDPADLANWPDFALVPSGTDPGAELYDPLLQGTVSASQGDVYFINWDGNPSSTVGRPHPLGVAVESRGLAWNFPAGNQDIIYFVYTLYNITSANAADYAQHRPALASRLVQLGQQFQASNEAAFGIDIPVGGYTLRDVFMDFAADQDVTAAAGANYSTFNNTFDLAVTYHEKFNPAPGNVFDPGIHAPPFLPGPGFVGTKYLRSPILPDGSEAGTVLAGQTTNRGAFPDPVNTTQLYRYISGNLSSAAGDPGCNTGNKDITRICFINPSPSDTRTFQSSGPLQLAPGASAIIVVAYMMAPPLSTGKCPSIPCPVTMVPDALKLFNATPASPGVDPVDSAMGYRGFSPGTTTITQEAVVTFPSSLLNKAKIAQSVFDGKFLLPFAPQSPEFFLVPGNNQVAILWRPSSSEASGDGFFAIASSPTTLDASGVAVPNTLYDPNYRQFDVEGYRIYRGRTDTPNSLQLLAQFDFAGTVITDFRGLVNPTKECAPELGIFTACPSPFTIPPLGSPFTDSVDVELSGEIIQIKPGDRVALATGEALVTKADTLVTGGNTGFPALSNTGVPFAFTDNGSGLLSAPRNNIRYFYAVTAFDVNSLTSGPASLESQRSARPVTPVVPASNFVNTATISANVIGRSGRAQDSLFPVPTINPTTGRFSGPFPPSDASLAFAGAFARQVISAPGSVSMRLDSLTLGSAYDATPTTYFLTATTGSGQEIAVALPITQDPFQGEGVNNVIFDAVPVDGSLAQRFGGNASFALKAEFIQQLPGNYYTSTGGRGCINGAPGFGDGTKCDYNGARWFDGPSPAQNETKNDPAEGNQKNAGGPSPVTNFNNSGALTGVTAIHESHSYQTVENIWRDVEAAPGGAARAADFNVYWGAGGKVDSVIDVTHDVAVAFGPQIGASWGFLNQSATAVGSSFDGRAELTIADIGCVEPLKSSPAVQGRVPCASATPYLLSETAVPGTIAYMTPTVASSQTNPPAAGQGFILYLPGHYFTFELAGGALPASGTVWSMRSYIGAITGGNGDAGNDGPYAFTPAPRLFSAVGATVRLSFDVVNQVVAATKSGLAAVHTVPDPYYVTSGFEQTTTDKVIKFVNLPASALIRIYTSSGVLVTVLEHNSNTLGGDETWNVRNRNNQVVASGVYFYHIESGDARKVGRFTVVNFAQ